MSSTDFVYDTGRRALNTAQIDLSSASIGAVLVSANYASQPALDQFLSDIDPSAIIVQGNLTNVVLNSAGCLLGILEFDALISPDPVVALVLFVDTTDPTTSQLLYYSAGGPGFPFIASGFNYAVGYDLNSGGFFQ